MVTGKALICENPKYSTYYWGKLPELSGKTLEVLEREGRSGDCLCLVDGKGIVNVDGRDIDRFDPTPHDNFVIDILELIHESLSKEKGGKNEKV